MRCSRRLVLSSALILLALTCSCTSRDRVGTSTRGGINDGSSPPAAIESPTGIRILTPTFWSPSINADGSAVTGFTSNGALAPPSTFSLHDVVRALRPSLKRNRSGDGEYVVQLIQDGELANYYTVDDVTVRALFEKTRSVLAEWERSEWLINPPTLVAIRLSRDGRSVTIMPDGSAHFRQPSATSNGKMVPPKIIPSATYELHQLARHIRPFLKRGPPTAERPYSVHIFSGGDRYIPFCTNEAEVIEALFATAQAP